MRMSTGLPYWLSVALCCAGHLASAHGAEQAQATLSAVVCGRVIDTAAGKVLPQTTIIVADDRIQDVVPGRRIPAGAREIDLSAQTCLPGLIDLHTHLLIETSPTQFADQFQWSVADWVVRAPEYARRTLLAGFTTVRDVGDMTYESVALRNAINSRAVVGPRIYTSGVGIGSSGSHADQTNGLRPDLAGDPGVTASIINGAEDAVKAVRLHYKANVDLIKIAASGGVMELSASADNPQLTLDEMKAICTTARDYGFTVAAHAHGAEAIRRAVLAGVDSIEHGTFMNEEDIKLMKEHGTWYVPTLAAGDYISRQAAVPGYYPPQIAAKAAAIGPAIIATAGRAYRAGVKIAFGTDAAAFPHGENAHEFELMVKAGMPPMFALQAATVRAAQVLKRGTELGSIAPGKWADIVAVDGDPLADISIMKAVAFVMKAGTVYKRDGKASDR